MIHKQNQTTEFYTEIKDNQINYKYINVGDNREYYDFLFRYLLSLEKAKYTTVDNEIKIQWSLVKYPDDLVNENKKQSTKDKKKYNYRIKARNYTIENNTLIFTGLAGKKPAN